MHRWKKRLVSTHSLLRWPNPRPTTKSRRSDTRLRSQAFRGSARDFPFTPKHPRPLKTEGQIASTFEIHSTTNSYCPALSIYSYTYTRMAQVATHSTQCAPAPRLRKTRALSIPSSAAGDVRPSRHPRRPVRRSAEDHEQEIARLAGRRREIRRNIPTIRPSMDDKPRQATAAQMAKRR